MGIQPFYLRQAAVGLTDEQRWARGRSYPVARAASGLSARPSAQEAVKAASPICAHTAAIAWA